MWKIKFDSLKGTVSDQFHHFSPYRESIAISIILSQRKSLYTSFKLLQWYPKHFSVRKAALDHVLAWKTFAVPH